MKEYIILGHIVVTHLDAWLNENSNSKASSYIRHHSEKKKESKTTKLRVGLGALSKIDTNISLNDCLEVGPVIQDHLISVVKRFRKHQFAITANVEKIAETLCIDRF